MIYLHRFSTALTFSRYELRQGVRSSHHAGTGGVRGPAAVGVQERGGRCAGTEEPPAGKGTGCAHCPEGLDGIAHCRPAAVHVKIHPTSTCR